jgi:hypothetical protein
MVMLLKPAGEGGMAAKGEGDMAVKRGGDSRALLSNLYSSDLDSTSHTRTSALTPHCPDAMSFPCITAEEMHGGGRREGEKRGAVTAEPWHSRWGRASHRRCCRHDHAKIFDSGCPLDLLTLQNIEFPRKKRVSIDTLSRLRRLLQDSPIHEPAA